jgi:hypothetical protein
LRDGRDRTTDELAKRAVVVLMYARTLRCSVRFCVRPNRRRCNTAGSGCINDADNARQESLGEGADEDPTANCSRESHSYWCHVTLVRTLTAGSM